MSGVGFASIPVTLSFANAAKEIQSKLKPQLDKLSKDAAKGIDKNIGSGVDAAAAKVEKAQFRVKKASEELSDAESKRKISADKSELAARQLAEAESKLADMKASGTASAEQLEKAEQDVLSKRAKSEQATLNLEKSERGLEKALTENARAADSLKDAEQQLEDATNGATDATNKFGDAAADADGKGVGLELSMTKVAAAGAAVVGALAAGGKAVYDIGASFDDAYDTIRIGTGASGAAFEDLQQSMRNVAQNSIGVGSDLGEIGTTLADLNTRLGVTGEPLEKLTTQFQQLKGMGMDVDINAVTGAFTQFGVEVEQMPGMMDKLLQISQATGRGMTDLVANLEKSGPALQQFGFGLEESAGLLGALDKAGLDSEKTLGSMTKALGEFAKNGQDPQEALWGTVKQIDELTRAGKDAEAIDLANSIFGAKGGAGFVAAVQSGQFAYDDFMESIGASGDTINGLAADTADFAEAWDQFKLKAMIAVEPIATAVFTMMVPALELASGVLEKVVGAFQGLAEWVQKSSDWLAPLGVSLSVVVAGLTAIVVQQKIMATGGLISWVTSMTKATTAWSLATKAQAAAQKLLNLALKSNPIGVVITAITALVAGLTYFFTKTEKGREIWSKFMDALRAAGEWISSTLGPMFSNLGDTIVGAFTWVRDKVAGVFDWIGEKIAWVKDYVSELWSFWSTGDSSGIASMLGLDQEGLIVQTYEKIRGAIVFLKDTAVATWQGMGAAWSSLSDGVKNVWQGTVDAVKAGFDWIIDGWNTLSSGLQEGWNTLKTTVVDAFQLAWQTLVDAFTGYIDRVKSNWDRLVNAFQLGWQTVKTIVIDVFRLAWEGLLASVQFVVNGITSAWSMMTSALQAGWNIIKTAVIDLFVSAWQGAQIAFQAVTDGIQAAWNFLRDVFINVWNGIKSTVVDAFISAWNSVKSNFTAALDAMKGGFNAFRDHLNSVINTIKGYFTSFVSKVKETAKQAVDEVKKIPRNIESVFKNAGQWLVNAGKNMIQGLINGILSMAGKIGNAITSIMPSSIGGLIGFSGGGTVPAYSRGGELPAQPGSGLLPRIPGIPRSVRDPIIGFNRAGLPIVRIEPEEFVVNRDDTRKNLPLLRAINSGAQIAWQAIGGKHAGQSASGGAGELPGYKGGGVIQPMINVVKKKYPMMTITSTVRKGDRGYHGAGLAVDFSNGRGNTPQMLALARDIAATYPNSLELIYDAPGFDKTIKNGKVVGRFGQYYTMAQAGPHHHHVHWAMNTAPARDLGSGTASASGGGEQVVKNGPANLPPMKWSEKMLTVNAVRAGRAVALQFPQVKTIGGYRPYDPYPDHPSGRALDIMTYTDKALGDRILNFLFDHPDFFKMQYAIWQKAMWYKKGAPQPMADRGSPTQNHMDHVHAYFQASPRATGSEVYPNSINAGGGGGVAAMAMGDANLPLGFGKGAAGEAADLKGITSKNVDYGTAAQLASKYDTDKHREEGLREYLKRKAKKYDTGGLFRPGDIAVNMGKPEVIFPADALTAMLQMARSTPQYVAVLNELSKHVPELARSIDRWTGLDYGAISREVGAAIAGTDFGYGELAKAIGEEAAEKIVTKLAFISDQMRDMADGSNMRAYLGNLRGSEGLALADQVGQLVGITKLNSTFGGVVKGFEAMEDAAVQQVDAAEAVKQAEENLADVRKQYAEMVKEAGGDPEVSTKTARKIEDAERKLKEAKAAPRAKSDTDGSAQAKKIEEAERALARVREDASEELKKSGVKDADALIKAQEAVTAAENEHAKALGVVKLAAQATGQAQVAMILEVAEMVITIGKQIWDLAVKITDWINGIRIATRTAVWELMKSWTELTEVVDQHRSMVAELQMQLVNAAVEVISKSMDVRSAQVDIVRAQLLGAKNVAEAEKALAEERDKAAGRMKWNFRDMSLEYDRFRRGYRDGLREQIEGSKELSGQELMRIAAALAGLTQVGQSQEQLTAAVIAAVDREGLAVKLSLDAKLAAQKAADDAYVASLAGREVGEGELQQMYRLQLAEQLVGEDAFLRLKRASLDEQLQWQQRVDEAAKLGLKSELQARAVVTPEILALQREVYAAQFAQQKSVLEAQIKGLEASFAQQQAVVVLGRLQQDLVEQSAQLARLQGETFGMNQGQAIVMEEIARLQKANAEILGKRDSAAAGMRFFLGRMFDWNGDGNNGTNTWSVERKQYDSQIAANNAQIAELQKSMYAKNAFTPAEQRQIDDAVKLAAKYFAQDMDDAAKAALAASPLGRAQRTLEVHGTTKRIQDWEKQQRDLQRSQQDNLAELRKQLQVLPKQWQVQELESSEASERYAAEALRETNAGVRDALATLSRMEQSNAAEMKQLREKPTVVHMTIPGPRDGVTTFGQLEESVVVLAEQLGATMGDVKRLNGAQRTTAADRVRIAIGNY